MKKINIFTLVFCMLLFAGNAWAGVARLLEVSGKVMCMGEDSPDWTAADVGRELDEGDRVKASPGGSARVLFYSGHSAVIQGDSSLIIREATQQKTGLELFKGRIKSKVKNLSKGQKYEVTTPQAVCAVRGTEFDVNITGGSTQVRVYEGLVEATELMTGQSVEIPAGSYSDIIPNSAPSEPQDLTEAPEEPEEAAGEEEDADEEAQEEAGDDEWRQEARTEMFEEISRESVLSRAAEEIKRAEYENGKALIDASGNRVRLEEYIVRPQDNQFKYVVLNTREDRLDFGKILFTFDSDLPEDLSDATGTMFYSAETDKPSWILTDLDSVMSNTMDKVNEVAIGGDMLQDGLGNWNHYFTSYEFSVQGYEDIQKILWTQTVSNTSGLYDDINITTVYYGGAEPTSEYSRPDGEGTFHLQIKDTYSDDTWIAVEDYLIDDNGEIQTSDDLADNFTSDMGDSFEDYIAELNFERKYTSSEFSGRDIDLVFSTKLLLDSGMLSIGLEDDGSN